MKKILLIIITFFLFFSPSVAFAQGMMDWGSNSNTSSSAVAATAQDQTKGKQIWEELQAKKLQCNSLISDNYELLGEYFMGQMIGDTQRHALMNSMMQNMMGKNGEEQMHIVLGKRGSGCFSNLAVPSNTPSFMIGMMNNVYTNGGGVKNMMGNWGWGSMMGWTGFGGFNLFSFLIFLVIFIDLVLLGVYLWKQINKK